MKPEKNRNDLWLVRLTRNITKRMKGFFEPEEVEITFQRDNTYNSYTYTKVNHKKVA